jgi:hypothetical protein
LQAQVTCPPLVAARTRRLLAEALVALGRLEESAALSEQGLLLLGHPMVRADLAGGRALLGALAAQVSTRGRAWGRPPQSARPLLAEEREKLNETYGLLSSYGEVSLYYCAEAQLFYSMLCITNIADRTGDEEQQVFSYAALGYAASAVPLDRLAESYLQQAEAALRRRPSLRGERQFLRLRCAARINRGRWSKASVDGAHGIAVCRAAGDDFGHLFILQMMAWISLFTGQVEQAAQRTTELRELAERSHNRQFLGWAHGMHSLALLMGGQTEAAMVDLEAAFPHVRAAADSLAERFVLSLRAACAVERNDLALARTYLDAALGLISTTPILAYATLHSVHFCAETCIRLLALTPPIAQGPLLARLAVAHSAQRRLARSLVIAKPRMLLSSGHEARFHGQLDAARQSYQRALALAQQLGMQDDVGRSRAALVALNTAD